jgi:hypothetical protein
LSDYRPDKRAAASQPMSGMTTRCTDAARRMARWHRARDAARRRRMVRSPVPFTSDRDWSSPLTGTRYDAETWRNVLIGATAAVDGFDVVEPAPSHSTADASGTDPTTLRCLIAATRLDVGGMDEVVAFLAPIARTSAAGRRAPRHVPPMCHWGAPGRLARMLRIERHQGSHDADESGAADLIERWRPDVISAHGALDWLFAIAQHFGVPYVDNLHGKLFGTGWRWHARAALRGKFSPVVAVSQLVRQQYLAGSRQLPPDRIVLILNGVDDEQGPGGDRVAACDPLGLTDEHLFVSLARHYVQENTYLLSSLGQSARLCPEAHLVIAGRSPTSATTGRC